MDDNFFQAVVVVVFALLREIGGYVSVGTAMAALARVVGGLIRLDYLLGTRVMVRRSKRNALSDPAEENASCVLPADKVIVPIFRW